VSAMGKEVPMSLEAQPTAAATPRPLSPWQVVRAAGITYTTWWRWSQGLSRPSPLALAKLDSLGIVLQLPRRKKRSAR
jgi:hypothetical protein